LQPAESNARATSQSARDEARAKSPIKPLPPSTDRGGLTGAKADWLIDPELKVSDSTEPVEWLVLVVSTTVMTAIYLWQSGSLHRLLGSFAWIKQR
jgi:hypothetical protein